VVRAKVRSDKKLLVKEAMEAESCLKYFRESAKGNQITELFQELKSEFKLGNEDVYLVMPDEMFELTDTANITGEAELRQFVEDGTGLKFDEVYVSTAIEATPGQYNKKTVYAMRKSLVDAIATAADKLNIQVDRGGKYGNGARNRRLEARKNLVACNRNRSRHNLIFATWRNFQVRNKFDGEKIYRTAGKVGARVKVGDKATRHSGRIHIHLNQ